MDRPLREEAEHLVSLAERDPRDALRRAEDLAERPHADAETVSVALRAAGIAAREMGWLDRARTLLDGAVAAAGGDAAAVARGRALICRAGLAALGGDTTAALTDLNAADELLTGPDAANVAVQRAAVVHQSGDLRGARDLYGRALLAVRRHGMALEEARVLSNRGLLGIHGSRYGPAARDLHQAASIYERLHHPDQLLFVAHNLGYLALCRGQLPEALAHFESVRSAAVASGADPVKATTDRAQALLIAGLTTEAEQESEAAADHYATHHATAQRADALVEAGRAALAGGAPDRAIDHLTEAVDLLPRHSRRIWRAVATSLLVAAHLEATPTADPLPTDELAATLAAAIDDLDHQSMHRYAAQARLVDLRLAALAGELDRAERRRAEVAPRLRSLPPEVRADYWLAAGQLAARAGDRQRALRSFGQGLVWNRALRRSLPWIETATSPGPTGAALAIAGLRAALTGPARPMALLRWIEAGYEPTPVDGTGTSPAATELADAQTEARMAAAEVDELLRAGADPEALQRAEQRRRRAERAVMRGARLPGQGSPGRSRPERRPPVRDLVATLGPSDLLELVTVDGRISAVTAVCGRLRRHDLGPVGPVLADIALVRTLLRRSWSAGAAHPGLTAPLDRLGRRLIPPTLARSARPVVVVHGPDLAGLPLGLVPALRARPSAIAPCLRSFAEQRSSPEPERRGAVFVAGPDLPAASAEVRASAAHHPSATILEGPAATVDRVLEALDAPLAHLACHGTVRHDSPLFSSLRLADGPLPIHLLPRAPTLPATVILSACDVGRPARAGGTHVLGLPAALLVLGVGAVVASNVAVPDAVTAEVMTELHGQLAAGLGPSAALAELRSADDGVRSLVAAAFTCHATSGGI